MSSLKGGVGKTSVTSGLASAALAAGLKTLVIDLDPHADLSTALGLPAGQGTPVGELLRRPKKHDLRDHVRTAPWVSIASAKNKEDKRLVLDVLAGSSASALFDRPDLSRRDLHRLETLVAKIDGYDLVLIDCPPSFSGLTRMAWVTSDDVVLVAEPGLFSVAGTERTLRALKLFMAEYAPSITGTHVVANRIRDDFPEHAYRLKEMREMFADHLIEPALPELHEWQQVQGAAYPIHQWPTRTARAAAQRFDTLLAQLRRV
ncbi:cellulose biosynthesis protein BcsQ [Falsarthrobacter nasiphocae]|uniref:Cellulose biosynthesis protein BcsQ n=1 Tax=Falsarthrobacter nasiphocae TaxID=189863 RepID=A0AAE4C7D6_9MICC|nr:cellulose biosynthesis protein BcsQ [Falsarthrobacter nasiphocae]